MHYTSTGALRPKNREPAPVAASLSQPNSHDSVRSAPLCCRSATAKRNSVRSRPANPSLRTSFRPTPTSMADPRVPKRSTPAARGWSGAVALAHRSGRVRAGAARSICGRLTGPALTGVRSSMLSISTSVRSRARIRTSSSLSPASPKRVGAVRNHNRGLKLHVASIALTRRASILGGRHRDALSHRRWKAGSRDFVLRSRDCSHC
jgi:hypothetical protein